ncbi:hypothetical protein [Amycolatopsis sp. NPDC098790]|uniref:hypothetical protein n=1 Tax=Amycolatopsis sp. NPDC098790 TaxID=3363939 RepID=UPI00380F49E1
MAEEPDLTGATVYEAAEQPSIGGGRWYALPDDTTYFKPTDGQLRPSLIPAHTLRDRPAWSEVAGG